jgi:hypothetical protein
VNTTLDIAIRDQANPALERLVNAMAPQRAAKVCGPRLREVTRDHLKKNPRNRRGWPSTGFWEDAARATSWEVIGDVASRSHAVLIRVNKLGVPQRVRGGTIRPVRRKFLTIPIASQAYGKTVDDFPGSFLITTRKGAYIVQYGQSFRTTTGTINGKRVKFQVFSGSKPTLEFLFKLVASVTQQPNPSLVPSAFDYTVTARAALTEYFREIQAAKNN